jgi:hypothetical protein
MLEPKGGSRMEKKVGSGIEAEPVRTNTTVNEYRDAMKKMIEREVGNIVDEEMRKAALELLEEQRKAIR